MRVTSIIARMRDETLERWKQRKVAQLVFTRARQTRPKILKDDIFEEAFGQFGTSEAAEEGTRRHAVMEKYLNAIYSRSQPPDEPWLRHLDDYLEQYDIDPVYTELEVEMGDTVGHIDLIGENEDGNHVVIDFKTGRWKGFSSIVQVGGYMLMYGADEAHLVYINDNGFEVVEVSGTKAENAKKTFAAMAEAVKRWDDLEAECLYI